MRLSSFPYTVKLYAQHIGNGSVSLPNGSTTDLVLLREPISQASYECDDGYEVTASNTTEALLIDKTFYFIGPFLKSFYFADYPLAKVRIGVKGDGTNEVHITKVLLSIVALSPSGSTSLGSTTLTFSTEYSSKATDYKIFDVQALIPTTSQELPANVAIGYRIKIWGYVDGGDQYVKLFYTRGSSDTTVIINYMQEEEAP